jgi:hypothetical protein
MIGPPSGTRIWLVASFCDLRKGVDGLSALVQNHLNGNPFSGEVYLFRGKSGNKIKVLWATPEGLCKPPPKNPLSQIRVKETSVPLAPLARPGCSDAESDRSVFRACALVSLAGRRSRGDADRHTTLDVRLSSVRHDAGRKSPDRMLRCVTRRTRPYRRDECGRAK